MTELKNVIGYLCRYINLLFNFNSEDSQLRAEYVRLAKFNKTTNNIDIIKLLWNLLKQFDTELSHFKKDLSVVNNVKLHFAHLNYLCLDFYALPEDMSFGSRELLIAFSWLLSNSDVVTTILENKIAHSSLNTEFPKHKSAESVRLNHLEKQTDCLNYAMWLLGKINNNLKNIRENDKIAIKNMKKIHTATKYDLDIPHLSVNDVYVVKNPEVQHKFLTENKTLYSILEARNKWEECQGIFWKWMDSVLEEKVNDTCGRNFMNLENLEGFLSVLKSEVRPLVALSSKTPQKLKKTEDRSDNFHAGSFGRYIFHVPKKNSKYTTNPPSELLQWKDSQCEKLAGVQREIDNHILKDKLNIDTMYMQVSDKINMVLSEHDFVTQDV